jgi:hypothetical protein
MTPAVQSALATAAALSFFMTSAGFMALVWRVSWGVRGFVEAETRRAAAEEELTRMLGEFIATQREHNDSVESALNLHGARLRALEARAAQGP